MVNQLKQEIDVDDANYEDSVTTGVDNLLDLLKGNEKISLSDAAKELGVNLEVVQSWVDFLVEEKIVGIEYKFTKPYIYLNKGVEEAPKEESDMYGSLKDDFINKAKEKNIPQNDLQFLWKNHVKQALEGKKDYFINEAMKRGLMANTEELWKEYTERFMSS